MSTCRMEVEERENVEDEHSVAESRLARKEANFGIAACRYYTPEANMRRREVAVTHLGALQPFKFPRSAGIVPNGPPAIAVFVMIL